MNLTSAQQKTVVAAFLGWMLDAFDFFLLVFLLGDIAKEFGVEVSAVTYAVILTLAMRFIGAFIFGRLGDRFGRKPILMLDIVSYSVIGALAAFSPSLWVFLALRALFGVAMGGEWGLGSSLAMESIPPQARGMVSGILQCGYPPAICSPRSPRPALSAQLRRLHLRLARDVPAQRPARARRAVHPRARAGIAAIRRGSKGAQAEADRHFARQLGRRAIRGRADDVLQPVQPRHAGPLSDLPAKAARFDHTTVSWITIVANLGAIAGGLLFGFVSEKIGRVNAITIAALIALPALPLWAYSSTPFMLAIGAFIMQVSVQGAWGVIPAHLNELSPGPVRATLPGFVYQAGNFLASYNGPFQAKIAESYGGDYGYALALVAGVVALAIVIVIRFSPERRGEVMHVAY